MLRDSPVRRLICRIDSPCRANIRISTACSWVNMSAAQKTAILAQVGHFYFGAVGQYYVGANIIERSDVVPTAHEILATPITAVVIDGRTL